MKKFYVIFLIAFFHSHLFPQFTENNFSPFIEFCETPYAEIMQNGIGNFGFDNLNPTFNPSYSNEFDRFQLNIGNIYNLSSCRVGAYNWENNGKSEVNYHNEKSLSNIPNLCFTFKQMKYQFQLSHRCTKKLDINSKKTDNGSYIKNKQLNNLIQISLSRNVSSKTSISIGALTNSYSYTHNYISSNNDEEKFKVSTDYFDQFQYIFSINYLYNQKIKSYFFIKSQNSKIKLSPEKFNNYYDNNSIVTYPGLLSFGIEYKMLNNLKLSFESLSDFLYTNDELSYYDSFNDSIIYFNYKHKIFNPMISIGANLELSNNISIGCLFAKYIKYDTDIYSLSISNPQRSFYEYDPPLYLIFSIQFKFSHFNFIVNYQFSSSSLEYENYNDVTGLGYYIGTGNFKNESQFLSLDIYYFK